jgi:lipopolysaccharide transport system ATP-binding protein
MPLAWQNRIASKKKSMSKTNDEVLIKCEGLSKKFCKDFKRSLWYGIKDVSLAFSRKGRHHDTLRKDEFWAVKDINFELRRGECLGLIGHNGAGKSTLLKILNGLITPDQGKVTMYGRVGALIELGAGFNPILTGRENIYNNGAVLGFSRKEIDAKIEAIIDFSEIRDFIDMPVQNYSSGMKVRLGFAVAAEMEPDILLIDEILAVGDAGFRMKSFNKITELMQQCAVIFVSHSMPTIARVCTRGLLMQKGEAKFASSNMHEIVEHYFDVFQGEQAKIEFNDFADIEQIKLNGVLQTDTTQIFETKFGEDLTLSLKIRIKSDYPKFCINMHITDKDMKMVAQSLTRTFHNLFDNLEINYVQLKFPRLTLINGEYAITIFVHYEDESKASNIKILASYRNYIKFKVSGLKEVLYVPYYLIPEIVHNQKKLKLKYADE